MQVPSIKFTEKNLGTVPILAGVRNRIGIVGEFSRGPSNVARFVGGYTDFANTYGSDISSGSLGFQAAWDQGARNFMLTRVLGSDKPANGSLSFSGIATKVNTLYVNLKFIGKAVDQSPSTPLSTVVVTSGKYTGSISGRYHFLVTAITAGTATVKYQFVPIGGVLLDWVGITTTISVTLATNGGTPILVTAGLSVAFGAPAEAITLVVNNSFSVRTNSYTYPVAINEEDIPSQIVSKVSEVLSGYDPIGEVTTTTDSVIFSLNPTVVEGQAGNLFSYYLSLADSASPGITITRNGASNATFMQGGVDGPSVAYRDFYSYSGVPLLRIETLSEGVWGNDVVVSIVPVTNSKFRITVEDLNGSSFNPKLGAESHLVSFSNLDTDHSLKDLQGSTFIRGYFLPKVNDPTGFDTSLLSKSPLRTAPPNATVIDVNLPTHPSSFGPSHLTNINLQFGYDGPKVTDNDYINAIAKFNGQPVHIVLTPGKYDSLFVKQALISHCENASVNDGLRIAILNSKPFLDPNSSKVETIGFSSDRAVMVTGWSTYAGQPNAPRYSLSPDAIYAGKIASLGHWIQPQAVTSAGPVSNITEVDNQTFNNTSSLQVFTDARLEILTLDNNRSAFYFTNGRTLDEGIFLKISTRRTFDALEMDINDSLRLYQSEPHTFLLRRQIVTGITTYLSQKLNANQIANYTTPICDNTNNSASSYSTGVLNVSFSFLDIAAADYIQVTVSRNDTLGINQIGV